jgi:energy-coupling factor transport system ATP-binding protein
MLEVKNVEYAYNSSTRILDGINLCLKNGEILAIVGRNGCGKTTLTKILMGLLLPTAGKLELDGIDVTKFKASEMAKKIGYVFQNPDRQLFANTVLEEVMYGPLQLGFVWEQAKEQAVQSLCAVDLSGFETHAPQMLSRGQKQRLSIASALAAKPQILIMDEPTSGQDCRERTSLLRLMRRLNHEGMGLILVTHDMDIVAEHADRVLALLDHKVRFNGSPLELFSDEDLTVSLGLELPETLKISKQLNLPICLTPREIYTSLDLEEAKQNYV